MADDEALFKARDIRNKIKTFLKDKSRKFVYIKYSGPNAAYDWQKMRCPIGMLWRGFWFQIIRKLPPGELKNCCYRLFGVKIGKNVSIGPDEYIDPLFCDLITIEDNVLIGWGGGIDAHEIMLDYYRVGRTTIKKGAVMGGFAFLRNGCTIGENAVLALLSYAHQDVPADVIMGGIPAKLIKELKPGAADALKKAEEDRKRAKEGLKVRDKAESEA